MAGESPKRRIAVVLFQIGGPSKPADVRRYLFNFFSDKAIIPVPQPARWLIANAIATRRAPITQEIYRSLGGRSPILENTRAQAEALTRCLSDGASGEVRAFVAMRYWHPFARETAREVKEWAPDRVVLLPLYPQHSTTTSGSALTDWMAAAKAVGLDVATRAVCCYPDQPEFASAYADLIRQHWPETDLRLRVLFTAHGLPVSIIEKGDPYADQVHRSAAAIREKLDKPELDWRVTYQSKVTPQEWLKPDTEEEIAAAGREGIGVVLVPLAFVSEHSETLVELDEEYRKVAEKSGVPVFARVPTVGTHPSFVEGLGRLVRDAIDTPRIVCGAASGPCEDRWARCGRKRFELTTRERLRACGG